MQHPIEAATTPHSAAGSHLLALSSAELNAVSGGVQSKGEEMCEFTEECERSQSRLS